MSLSSPPKENELEISLFGPGFGESTLLHLGNNQWVVIDSCVNHKNKHSIPLDYLRLIKVNPQTDIKMIVATHWHDDHIRGLSQLVEKCTQSNFVCSAAILNKEFLTFVKAYDAHTKIEETGVTEFSKIFEILKARTGRMIFAIADKLLLKESFNAEGINYEATIHSLSPSDEDFKQATLGLGGLLGEIIGPTRRAIKLDPNNVAIVLDVTISGIKIILGSDLEVINNDNMGWNAIMNHSNILSDKFEYFKVAHHGSLNGHHHKFWEDHLSSDTICTLTPFEKGRHNIPSNEDTQRICIRTKKSFSTKIKTTKIKRERNAEKMIKEVVGNSLRLKSFSEGHIRCRRLINNSLIDWSIELFSGADRLCGS